MARPRLEFAVQAWSPYTRRDINVLESIQRRATKLIPSLTHLSYEDRLSSLDLTTLEARRERGDMIETFKIPKGFDRVGGQEGFLKLNTDEVSRTPGDTALSLRNPDTTPLKGTCSFHQELSMSGIVCRKVINSTSINTFKNRFDQHVQNVTRKGTPYEP